MQKLPEVPNRKRGWHMRKRKKASSWQRGPDYLSLSGGNQRFDNIVADVCLGTTHTSLDMALVSPFHPIAALSRSAFCWNIKDPQRNYKLTLTGLWQNFQKKTNPYGSPKYQMRTPTYKLTLTGLWQNFQKKTNPYGSPKYQMWTPTYMKRLTHFCHLN